MDESRLVVFGQATPAPHLAPYLRGLLSVRLGAGPGCDALSVPHGSLVFSLQLGAPLRSDEPGGQLVQGSALTGLRTAPVRYRIAPGTRSLIALLTPRAAWAAF